MGKLKKCKKENKELAFEIEEAKNGEGLYHNLILKIESIIKSSASEQDKIDMIGEKIRIVNKEYSKMFLAYNLFKKGKIKSKQLYKNFSICVLDLF